jgi:hypothetical protein
MCAGCQKRKKVEMEYTRGWTWQCTNTFHLLGTAGTLLTCTTTGLTLNNTVKTKHATAVRPGNGKTPPPIPNATAIANALEVMPVVVVCVGEG